MMNTLYNICGILCLTLSLQVFAQKPSQGKPGELSDSKHIRLELPATASLKTIKAWWHQELPADDENYGSSLLGSEDIRVPLDISKEGIVSFPPYSDLEKPNKNYIIEIVGPDIRRAIFPMPYGQWKAGKRPVFELETGASATLTVLESETDQPVANALLGPIIPNQEVDPKTRRASYPFFIKTDEQGRAAIEGLFPGVRYLVPIYAEGYQRRNIEIAGPEEKTALLNRGGATITGFTHGHRSQEAIGDIRVIAERANRSGGSVSDNIHVVRLSDDKGEVTFDGLPAGDYNLYAYRTGSSALKATKATALEEVPLEGLWLPVFEGISISGRVVDHETGDPVAGLPFSLIPLTQTGEVSGRAYLVTDAAGAFQSDLLMHGATLPEFTHPDYVYKPEDQQSGLLPLESEDWSDLTGVELRVRRKRFIEVTLANYDQENGPVILDIWRWEDPHPGSQMHGVRITENPQIIPVDSLAPRLVSARQGRRFISPMEPLKIESAQTTTSLLIELQVPAKLTGRVVDPDRPEDAGPPQLGLVALAPAQNSPEEAFINGASFAIWSPQLDGSFALDFLPPGTYTVLAQQGNATARKKRPLFRQEVTLTSGATSEIDIVIDRGERLVGRVIDEEEKGLREIPLRAWGIDTEGNPFQTEVMSGDEGRFSIEGFGTAQIELLVIDHHAYAFWQEENFAIGPGEKIIKLGEKPKIIADVKGAASGTAYLLVGRMVDLGVGPMSSVFEIEESQTLEAGQAAFQPRDNNLFRVAAKTAAGWDVSDSFEWVAKPNVSDRTFTLQPGCSASLRVEFSNLPDGVRPDSLQIELVNTALPGDNLVATAAPEPSGRNELIWRKLPPGAYVALGSGPNGEPLNGYSKEIACGSEGRIELDFLANEAEISGQIVEAPGGKGIAGAQITLFFAHDAEGVPLFETKTNSEGYFRIAPLAASSYYILKLKSGNIEETRMLSGAQAGLEIILSQAPKVSIILTPELRTRLEGASQIPLIFLPEAGGETVIAQFDQLNGLRLKAGRWRVMHGEGPVGFITVPANGGSLAISQE